MNVAAQEPFEEAQREVLGADHAYPMIAFGTLKKKAAFKMYARAQKLDFDIANRISNQISDYDDAMKYAESDEDREALDIFDFVDPEYHDYVRNSKPYWGIVSSKSKAPCAYLLYQGSIRREIGLIKCKSEATKREYITTVIDGAVAEEYKFLKNDWLIVDTVFLTDAVFKRIGIKPLTVNDLSAAVKGNKAVWDIYAKGLTIGVNQCEKPNAIRRLMRYRPQNVSELAAFIAAIRPGFKTMYSIFESRAPFSYNIKVLDDLIQTEEFPYSFILYQETLMSVLNLAGFPMDECYGIIKAIAKKHPEKVRPLKAKFIEGFKKQIMGQCPEGETEDSVAEKVWKIIDDSTSYSFNSAHAACMAYDSLYNAWQKATYPYEFYEVLLQHFSNKGKKDKVAALKKEMKVGFGIDEGPFKWGLDNTSFKADPENHQIIPSLLSIKGISKTCATQLYNLSQKVKCADFYDVFCAIKQKTKVNVGQIEKLIKLNYFAEFGNPNQLLAQLDIFDKYHGKVQLKKADIDSIIPHDVMLTLCEKETEKQYGGVDSAKLIRYLCEQTTSIKTKVSERIRCEAEYMGYIRIMLPNLSDAYHYVIGLEGRFSNKTATMYRIHDGATVTVKIKGKTLDDNPIAPGDIIRVDEIKEEGRWSKDQSGNWSQSKTDFESILRKYAQVK